MTTKKTVNGVEIVQKVQSEMPALDIALDSKPRSVQVVEAIGVISKSFNLPASLVMSAIRQLVVKSEVAPVQQRRSSPSTRTYLASDGSVSKSNDSDRYGSPRDWVEEWFERG